MKEVLICPKCSRESPPMELKQKQDYQFCPYCGASYREERDVPASKISGTRSRIVMEPCELKKIVKRNLETVERELERR